MSTKGKVKSKKKTDEITEKLRILCLHGYRQNDLTFKSKIGSFRKHVQKYAEFVFVNAPHVVADDSDDTDQDTISPTSTDDSGDTKSNGVGKETGRSWWFNKDDNTFKGTNKNGPAYGFDVSLRTVEEAWQTQGPFHGLLGFSQGACFVGLICNLSMRGMTVIKPQFAVLASGFRSGSLAHSNYYEDTILMPSLHVIGDADEIIPASMSEELVNVFEEPTVVRHTGGHYFAATSKQKLIYVDFFRNRLVEHLEKVQLEKAEEIILESSIEMQNPSNSMATSDDSD